MMKTYCSLWKNSLLLVFPFVLQGIPTGFAATEAHDTVGSILSMAYDYFKLWGGYD